MSEAEINGARLYYEVHGEGFPVIFTHGLGGDGSMWVFQVPEFREKYKVVVWDVRGHGRSETTENGYTIDQFVEDLRALMDHLGIEKAHIAGLSMGGWISWRFALAYPGLTRSLVLSDSAGLPHKQPPEQREQQRQMFEASAHVAEKHGRAQLADATIPLMFAEDFIRNRPDIINMVKEKIVNDPGVGYARTVRGIFLDFMRNPPENSHELLARITAPTLIIAGDKDILTPLPTQEALLEGIKGSRLEVISGSGHVPPMEKPERWNRLVLDFYRELEQSG